MQQQQQQHGKQTQDAQTWWGHDLFRLTRHYTNVTVAIGEEVVEGRLLWQTPDGRRLPKRAHVLPLFHVEALHLVGQTHHLATKSRSVTVPLSFPPDWVKLPWESEGAGWHWQKGSAPAGQTKWPGERKEGRGRSRRGSTLEQTCGRQTPCEGEEESQGGRIQDQSGVVPGGFSAFHSFLSETVGMNSGHRNEVTSLMN